MKTIKVLVIGQGFMGGIAHPRAILEANLQLRPRGLEFVMDCVAGRDADKLSVTKTRYGYNRASTDWEKEVGKADMVVVAVPNKEHAPMAIAALKAGKAVVCEKPLSSSLEKAQEMAAAAKAAGAPTMVTFCYQGAPGVLEARRLVRDGLVLGNSGYFEGASEFLQDWGRSGCTGCWHRFLFRIRVKIRGTESVSHKVTPREGRFKKGICRSRSTSACIVGLPRRLS